MSFSVGDVVEVTDAFKVTHTGVIELVTYTATYHMGLPSTKAKYGVRLKSEQWLQYYNEWELTLVSAKADQKSLCDCGAVKAAAPYPPSGHAYYCLLFKDNK